MCFLLVLAVVAASGLFILLLLKQRETRALTEELRRIRAEGFNSLLTLSVPAGDTEALVSEINAVLEQGREARSDYLRSDTELRHAIENVSHDLRTPLTSIMGYVQLIRSPDVPPQDKEKYLQIVEQRCHVLQRLITRFYDLSRLQAGEYRLEIKQVNLSQILCELLAAFYNDFSERGLEPDVELDSAVCVCADEDAVIRVFSNLMQNALRYAKTSLGVKLYQQEGKVYTELSNDVGSLEQKDVSRLFDRFFMADRVRSGSNTGLGLAITKMLVEQMGYCISTEFDQNTLTFRICWSA